MDGTDLEKGSNACWGAFRKREVKYGLCDYCYELYTEMHRAFPSGHNPRDRMRRAVERVPDEIYKMYWNTIEFETVVRN